jgi:hypothetical protein
MLVKKVSRFKLQNAFHDFHCIGLWGVCIMYDLGGGIILGILLLSFGQFIIIINPLSAMVAIWRHILVSFQVFGTEKKLHWNLDILGDMHQ